MTLPHIFWLRAGMSASNHPWPVSIYGTPQRDDERSKPFLSFSLSFFLFSFFTALRYDSRHHHPSFRPCKVLTQEQDQQIFLLLSFSSQRKSQFSCICPTLFSSYRIYFSCCVVLCLGECGVCAVSIPCSCACDYPVLILIDEPSPTVLDSDADRVSRPACLLIS